MLFSFYIEYGNTLLKHLLQLQINWVNFIVSLKTELIKGVLLFFLYLFHQPWLTMLFFLYRTFILL